jgi:hypothetical protein
MKWRDWRLAFSFALAGLLWCVAAGALLYFLPLGMSVSTTSSGAEVESKVSLSTSDPSSLWSLLVPVLLSAVAMWAAARHHRWPLIAAAVLVAAFALLGALSVGLAYVPAALFLVVSVLASSSVRQTPDGDGSAAGKD